MRDAAGSRRHVGHVARKDLGFLHLHKYKFGAVDSDRPDTWRIENVKFAGFESISSYVLPPAVLLVRRRMQVLGWRLAAHSSLS